MKGVQLKDLIEPSLMIENDITFFFLMDNKDMKEPFIDHSTDRDTEQIKNDVESSNESNQTQCDVSKDAILITNGEDFRLGGRMPFTTLIILSIGPVISQIFSSLFGVFNSLWVTKYIGSEGLEVFGAAFVIDYIMIGFAQYLMISINIRISYLHGEKATEKCGQLYVDFLRLAIVFGSITACIIIPITKPLTKWLGAPDNLANMCFNYVIPEASLSCVSYLYMIGCGVLQAEGHSMYFCFAQTATFVLNILVFDPIFFMWLKTPIWGCTLATAISQLIVGSIVNFLILRGTFSFKPKAKMVVSKFTSETGRALLVGIPELVMELSLSIPLIMMQKYIEKASNAIGIFAEAMESWALTQRLYTFTEAFELGFVFGMLPAASYAYGAKRYNRVLKLTFHLLWLATLISSVLAYSIIIFVKPISSIWSTDEMFLEVSSHFIPVIFYAMPLIGLGYMAPALLEAMQKALPATILSVLSLLLTPMVVSSILHFTKRDDPYRVMLTYPISDGIAAAFYVAFTLQPLIFLWKAPKDEWEVKMRDKMKKEKEEKKKKAIKLNKVDYYDKSDQNVNPDPLMNDEI